MRDRVRGFSLLEAIVALTIVAVAILGAYAWVAGNIVSLTRVRDLALEEAALHQALGTLEQTDPVDGRRAASSGASSASTGRPSRSKPPAPRAPASVARGSTN